MKKPNEKKTYKPIERPTNGENNFAERVFAFVDYQRAVSSGVMDKNCKCYTNALYSLSDSLVSCVLKKIYGSSCNETIRKMRAERDKYILDNLSYASDNSREKGYNSNGEPIEIIKDSELDKSIKTLIGEGVSSRFDLVQNTALSILETVSRLTPEEIMRDELWTPEEPEDETEPDGEPEEIYVNFLTKQIYQKRVNRRVYITDFLTQSDKTKEDQIKTVTIETTALQSFCKDIRAYILDENRPSENPQKFYYIDNTYETEDGETVSVYERFIPSVMFDFNGLETRRALGERDPEPEDQTETPRPRVMKKEELQTVSLNTMITERMSLPLNPAYAYESLETLVSLLGLTDKQQKVLAYRLKSSGAYGSKAISSATGYSLNTVKSALREIRRKMRESGLTAEIETYIDLLETHTFDDIKAKYIESGIMPEPPRDGVKRPIPKINITVLNTAHRPEPEIKKTMRPRELGVYAIDKTRAHNSRPEDKHILDFKSELTFDNVDISMICDPERPTAKSEGIENRAETNFDKLSDSELLLWARYVMDSRPKEKTPLCDYWYKHLCEYSIKTVVPDVKGACKLVSIPDQTQKSQKRPRPKTAYEREIIRAYLPPRATQK